MQKASEKKKIDSTCIYAEFFVPLRAKMEIMCI